MEDRDKKLEIVKAFLGAAFVVLVVGIGFGLGWYAKELSVIKLAQLKLQEIIEDVENDARQMAGEIAEVQQEQLKLQGEIKGIQDNMDELAGDIAKTIEQEQVKLRGEIKRVQDNVRGLIGDVAKAVEQNQLKMRNMVEKVQEDVREISTETTRIRRNQLEIQGLVERISKEVLPRGSLEVVSTEPVSPAVLNFWERFYVKFRYHLGASDKVQIWVRPYTRGAETPGYRANGFSYYKKAVKESGVAKGWFCFDKPTLVDEVRVYMRDVASGKEVYSVSHKIDARWVRGGDKRVLIDIDNPDGETGWKSRYVIELKPTGDISKEFGVDWYRPHKVASISTGKPDFINVLPKFKRDMQRYLILKLGDTENNQIFGVMDFRKPDRNHFPFDLYLDRDRDGNLAEDFIGDRSHIDGIQVPYKDGTTENYALDVYSYSTDAEPIGVAYQSLMGRYGILEADKKRIQILVIDNGGNGVFNDDNDVILLDWDLDGMIDGSHSADDDRPLYSLLELPGGSYRVVEFDAPGRRMVLMRQEDRK